MTDLLFYGCITHDNLIMSPAKNRTVTTCTRTRFFSVNLSKALLFLDKVIPMENIDFAFTAFGKLEHSQLVLLLLAALSWFGGGHYLR